MYALLTRQDRTPQPITASWVNPSLAEVRTALPINGQLWSIDIETRGLDPQAEDSRIVGIGFACGADSYYLDCASASVEVTEYVKEFLCSVRLTAFNVMYEGVWFLHFYGRWLNWEFCSFAAFKQLSGESFPGQTWGLETAQRDVLGWTTSNKEALNDALKERGLGRGDMWQLPTSILAPYCAADAVAGLQLHEVLTARAAEFPELMDYHQRIFLPQVRLLAQQQLRGLMVDQTRLETCRSDLHQSIDLSMNAFLNHPDVAHHIAAYNEEVRKAWIASQPPQLTKAGKVSARWEQWRDREASYMAKNGFNVNSKQQLAALFYEKLGFKPFKFTPTGRPVVDRKVLPALGQPGKLLAEYNLYLKRRGYVERVRERSERDGLIHPQFNSVGTVTLRPSGTGGLNFLQMPKTADFMWSLRARPGMKLIQADAEALEPTILAEFSKDKTLLSLYGPDAKPNDIYLFVSAKIPALGKEIRQYYDPDNPTPEGIKLAKKHCKRQRSIAKTVVLAANYNAGANKIHETLKLGGIDITLMEVRQILRDYWVLFAGVKRFEQQLTDMWTSNRGWFPTILGTPACVCESLVKDINNRFCQTSASLFLQLWVYHTDKLRQERGIEMYPWLVNFYDETLWEAPDAHAEAAAQAVDDALALTNAELGIEIPIRGPAMIIDTLAEAKVENFNEWLNNRSAA